MSIGMGRNIISGITSGRKPFLRAASRMYSDNSAAREIPAAGDVLYKNPEAITNRIQIFHQMRLQTQHRIDEEHLSSIYQISIILIACKQLGMAKKSTDHSTEKCIRITSKYISGQPGCERQFDPSSGVVALKVNVDSLGLSAEEKRRFLQMVSGKRYHSATNSVFYSVKDFPFSKQNRIRALNILKELVSESRNTALDLVLSHSAVNDGNLDISKPVRQRARRNLKFPTSWLPMKH